MCERALLATPPTCDDRLLRAYVQDPAGGAELGLDRRWLDDGRHQLGPHALLLRGGGEVRLLLAVADDDAPDLRDGAPEAADALHGVVRVLALHPLANLMKPNNGFRNLRPYVEKKIQDHALKFGMLRNNQLSRWASRVSAYTVLVYRPDRRQVRATDVTGQPLLSLRLQMRRTRKVSSFHPSVNKEIFFLVVHGSVAKRGAPISTRARRIFQFIFFRERLSARQTFSCCMVISEVSLATYPIGASQKCTHKSVLLQHETNRICESNLGGPNNANHCA